VSVEELRAKGRFRRLAMSRRPTPGEEHAPKVDRNSLREAVLGAGEYLARNVRLDGSYAYEIDGQSGEESQDYNLPRHSGATWFLAEAAGYSRDPKLERSVRRAARYLARTALVDCGERRCIAQREQADLGSSALALLAFAELVQNGVAPELLEDAVSLAEFLVSQQRPDGEFQHLYDRVERHPIDVQLLYYTGEASYALSKIYRITHDPRYLAAARGALGHLVKQPIWAPALRYYWGAEHWTCHALEDLWDAAPNHEALEFCLRWLEFVGRTAVSGREVAPEYDGASATGPFLPPQLVATATRLEAAVATLAVARKAKLEPARIDRLESEIRAAFRFLMRYQFLPGPMHLMRDPERMYGGVPASETDFRVRIDYPQHAGTGLLAYLKQLEQGRRATQ
ncbi:MAG TPA: hypothetical protein VFQ61_03765, partial [Polyangiaceae bacterium]|nr:hypothetical protein [Polyangiaceae bacterium]